jgi:hypothetical protein
MANAPTSKIEPKAKRTQFYGYNYSVKEDGRCHGEDVCGSGVFYIFKSLDVFKAAVTEYNILGVTGVKTASEGRA